LRRNIGIPACAPSRHSASCGFLDFTAQCNCAGRTD